MCRIGVGLIFFPAVVVTNGEKGSSVVARILCLREAALAADTNALDLGLVTSELFVEHLLLILQL
jgi:hypothetical protein